MKKWEITARIVSFFGDDWQRFRYEILGRCDLIIINYMIDQTGLLLQEAVKWMEGMK